MGTVNDKIEGIERIDEGLSEKDKNILSTGTTDQITLIRICKRTNDVMEFLKFLTSSQFEIIFNAFQYSMASTIAEESDEANALRGLIEKNGMEKKLPKGEKNFLAAAAKFEELGLTTVKSTEDEIDIDIVHKAIEKYLNKPRARGILFFTKGQKPHPLINSLNGYLRACKQNAKTMLTSDEAEFLRDWADDQAEHPEMKNPEVKECLRNIRNELKKRLPREDVIPRGPSIN